MTHSTAEKMHLSLLFLFLSLPHTLSLRFTKHHSLLHRTSSSSHPYLELSRPLPTDPLPSTCHLTVFRHSFGDTIGIPPVSVPYSPPSSECGPPWSAAVLETRVESVGEQYDRIVGVWLGGAEILRTSTAQPNEDGVFWVVRKDISRYNFLLQSMNLTLSVMLENLINEEFTGFYNVTLTILFYKNNNMEEKLPSSTDAYESPKINYEPNTVLNLLQDQSHIDLELNYDTSKKGAVHAENKNKLENTVNFYETPADLIIPISDTGDDGFWFRMESESAIGSKKIRIPKNTRKAVIELYVSFHGNDEFWYQNPPDSYINSNNLTTGRAHGSYREVFVTINGNFIGSVVPFPVIFTGGINPLFWEPVVSIGAFNLPSYDFDLTPFLGHLLDKKAHSFGIGVSDSISFWLINANLHLWLDRSSSTVEARVTAIHTPSLYIKRSSDYENLDGLFKIEAKRKSYISGWVKSSQGNFTTYLSQKFWFKNYIKFEKNGTSKLTQQRVVTRTDLTLKSEKGNLISHAMIKRVYPLKVAISTIPGSEPDVYTMVTDLSHSMKEKSSVGEHFSRFFYNVQDSNGWMLVKDHNVLSGSANTNQSFSVSDESGCYSRIVSAKNGDLIRDNTSLYCLSF